ncbi:MAG TPA: histidine-type phosphatase [Terriglobales bacterium]|nr:histidine-type phosphatase [Terriglobales bacterium]
MFIALLAFLVAPVPHGPTVRPHPVYALVLTRHGVRAPVQFNAELNRYSRQPWPDFGVLPADLTEHGRTLMVLYGTYYRAFFAKLGLTDAHGCAASAHTWFWADTDERTVETGKALTDGMYPGCKLVVGRVAVKPDPLIRPVEAGLGTVDSARALASVRSLIPGNLAQYASRFQTSIERLRAVLGVPAAPWMSAPTVIKAGSMGMAQVDGPIRTGGSLAEALELEYTDGMSGAKLGWGRLDRRTLEAILPLHIAYARLMLAAPYEARERGSNLLVHIQRSLEQAARHQAVDGALGHPDDTLAFVVGHDTNITSVAVPLGLHWKLPGYAEDDTPPGSAIIFELWQEAAGNYTVHIAYTSQSLDQMHDGTPLTLTAPPLNVGVTMAGCSPCTLEKFSKAVGAATDSHFVRDGR